MILDAGCLILDTGYWMLDTGYWMLDKRKIYDFILYIDVYF
jgi:hypothetical protein